MSPRRLALLLVIALGSLPAGLAAQPALGADAVYRTDYVWRGITLSNRAVLQTAAFGGAKLWDGFASAGAWWGFEPFEPAPGDVTDAGRGAGSLAEVDYWIQYERRFGWRRPVDVRVGWTAYTFHGDTATGGRGSEWDSSELYAGVTAFDLLGPLGIFGSAWKDLGSIGGLYSELGLRLPLPIYPGGEPLGAIMLDAKAGFSWGQVAGEAPASGYYAGEGLTHLDFALVGTPSLHFIGAPVTLFGGIHLQVGVDDRTLSRRLGGSEERVFFWLEFGASVWHAFGRPEDP